VSLLDLIFGKKKTSASMAKERLQLILAHERSAGDETNSITWLPQLQEELLQVIAKYISIDKEALKVNLEKRDNLELLEINVTLPEKEENKNGSAS
jgi:cell division topological specificity factor